MSDMEKSFQATIKLISVMILTGQTVLKSPNYIIVLTKIKKKKKTFFNLGYFMNQPFRKPKIRILPDLACCDNKTFQVYPLLQTHPFCHIKPKDQSFILAVCSLK